MRLAGTIMLLALAVGAAIIIARSPFRYDAQDRTAISAGTSPTHLTGTDDLGRDRTVRVAAALLLGLAGAVLAAAVATGIATSIGVAAAFAPTAITRLLLFAADVFLALPSLFLLMMVRAALPLNLHPLESAVVTYLLLALLGWPLFARLSYTRARSLRRSPALTFARAAGIAPARLALRHVVPHLRPLFFAQFLILIPAFLAAEANLGTLGLGVSEPLASWGSMLLALGNSSTLAGSHWVFLPVAMLVLLLLLLESMLFEAKA